MHVHQSVFCRILTFLILFDTSGATDHTQQGREISVGQLILKNGSRGNVNRSIFPHVNLLFIMVELLYFIAHFLCTILSISCCIVICTYHCTTIQERQHSLLRPCTIFLRFYLSSIWILRSVWILFKQRQSTVAHEPTFPFQDLSRALIILSPHLCVSVFLHSNACCPAPFFNTSIPLCSICHFLTQIIFPNGDAKHSDFMHYPLLIVRSHKSGIGEVWVAMKERPMERGGKGRPSAAELFSTTCYIYVDVDFRSVISIRP